MEQQENITEAVLAENALMKQKYVTEVAVAGSVLFCLLEQFSLQAGPVATRLGA